MEFIKKDLRGVPLEKLREYRKVYASNVLQLEDGWARALNPTLLEPRIQYERDIVAYIDDAIIQREKKDHK